MATFRYRALNAKGEMLTGELDDVSAENVIRRLQKDGHFPIQAEPASGLRTRLGAQLAALRRIPIRPRDLVIFARELSSMLLAGVALERALQLIQGVTENATLARSIGDILTRVQRGSSLADALASQTSIFPPLFVSLVRAGEMSGSLAPALSHLSEYLGRAAAFREAVKSALVYPTILLFMAGVSIVIMLTMVLPAFEPLFQDVNAAMPFSAVILLGISHLLRDNAPILLAVLAAAGFAFTRLMKREEFRQKLERFQLRLPAIGDLLKKIEASRFARTLAALLGGGLPAVNAVALAQGVIANGVIRNQAQLLQAELREGRGFGGPMARSKLFPELLVSLVRVGEETGQLERMLGHAADLLEEDVRRRTERLLSLLVPVLTVVLGIVIAAVIGTLLVTILSVNDLAT